ncbi:MAG TPA: dTDP-4-dehydrorhamnose reductase [Vicinamibacterales bacterium]|jgi:dTDP-4-dehydrorhamnose reductase
MRILVAGAAGQLGATMLESLAGRHDVIATTLRELDIRDHRAVTAAVREARPAAVINCTAFTDVDRAEDEPVEALDVNAFGVRALALAARDAGAAFVHFSTDFVFDGAGTRPYTEDDLPNPRSAYACSKLIGEWFARDAGRHYVLRVESLFGAPTAPGAPRRSSVDVIVDSILAGREARVFVDRTVSPSYTRDVAAATALLIEREAPSGLYHCVNSGHCTWHELGLEVGRQVGVEARLAPVRMADVKLRAARPIYCALDNRKLAQAGMPMPTWQDALARHLSERTKRP